MTSAELRGRMRDGTFHFMGIGGAGMCALAEAMVRAGARVTGCDLAPGSAVLPLERMGVRVHREHDPGHVEGAALLVHSAAVPPDHPELEAARQAGIPVLKRAEALGLWVREAPTVAVAGTHGKTTTTAMVTTVLERAGLAPTGFVGGEVTGWESHLRPGGQGLFVVEADEYDRSFLHLHPRVAVVTNVEADHLDIYGSLEGVREGFRHFLQGVEEGGTVIACADDPGAGAVIQGMGMTAVTYGFSAGAVLRAEAMSTGAAPGGAGRREPAGRHPAPGDAAEGLNRVRIREGGEDRGTLAIGLPGRHNLLNALAAAAVARSLGVKWEPIREGLLAFRGVRRRFERLGEVGGILVVDDYAHHPTELAATLEAARTSFPGRRIVAVFQPHLFTRTRDHAPGFGAALAGADASWVTAVYPAREPAIEGVDGALVARAARAAGAREVHLHEELATLPDALAATLGPGDLCLTLGAGSIEKTGPALLARLREGSDA